MTIWNNSLWGNPSHLDQVAAALKERHGENIHILCAKENSGNFTYDGIELGGERLAHEIEDTLDTLHKTLKKLRLSFHLEMTFRLEYNRDIFE